MSYSLINRNADLKRLRDEGFEVEVRSGFLLVHSVPYVNSQGHTALGILASDLALAGDLTHAPGGTHVAYFIGDHPCDLQGAEIGPIKHSTGSFPLVDGLVASHSFSNKPATGYTDYHHKMARYIEIISAPAQARDPSLTARTFKRVEVDPQSSVFAYIDTASSRAGIESTSTRLAKKVAIVGLGGTGSYVLDLLAKTPATEIHIFDGDRFFQHNAFRSPGAASLDQLMTQPKKVEYFKTIYSNMHTKIVAHDAFIDEGNVGELSGFDVVFLCVDKGSVRKLIMDALVATNTPFIDVGMGVEVVPETGQLLALCRVTSATVDKNDHIASRVSMGDRDEDDLYAQNIQIADLNMLNATMAVIKWKKMCGFYADLDNEHHSTYSTHLNLLTSDELTI
jgi:hypothetical protein